MVISRENGNGRVDLRTKDLQLVDLLKFLFKWKYIILAGTIIFAIVSGFVEYRKPTLYKVSEILKVIPSTSYLNLMPNENLNRETPFVKENAINISPFFPLESPENIMAIIELGILDQKLKQYLKNTKNIVVNDFIDLEVKLLGENNIIKVTYKTSEPKKGVMILDSLKYVLLERYKDKIQSYRSNNRQKIQNEIIDKENEIKLLKLDIETHSNRIIDLRNEISLLERNNYLLNTKIKKFGDENKIDLTALISYNQIYQKNIELINKYKSESNILQSRIEQKKIDLKKLVNDISFYNNSAIENNSEEENTYIEILEPPENMVRAMKSKLKISIFLGAIFGFSLAVLIAFVSQYISIALKQDKL